MASAVVEIEVPVEETEAYHELLARAGPADRRISGGAAGPARAGVCAGRTNGRRGSRRWTPCCAGSRRRARTSFASRRGRRKAGCSGSTSPAGPARARGPIARLCTGSTRSRAAAIAPISSRTRWASASTSWSCSSTSTPARASCSRRGRNRSGATRRAGTGLCWDPIRPLTGLGDWLDRVVWKGDVEAAKARSARVAQALRWFRVEQGRRRATP